MNSVDGGALKKVGILTTDPEKRIGLYAIRYLGRAGADIHSISEKKYNENAIGFRSAYVKTRITTTEDRFRDALKNHLIRSHQKYQIIYPVDISKMLDVMDIDREYGLNLNYLLPKRESLVTADNKELLSRHLDEINLNHPKTFLRVHPDELEQIGRSELTYPCIIKFRGDKRESSWSPEERYSIVTTPEMLASEYRRMHSIEEYPIIQEYIYGRGFGYFALFDKKGKLKAQFCHKRIREYPVNGGPSSCCESFYDPDIIRIGMNLLESLEWNGLAMVEFKFDEIRKRFSVLEINPRMWGSLPLAVLSGVNFPVLHALSSLEVDYEPVLDYRSGTKIRFIDKDIKAILSSIRNEKKIINILKLWLDVFNPTIKDGFIALDDMGPFLQNIYNRYMPG